ncbi:MAG: hypothetical protein WCD70_08560 [Alphaproteobacteria bacterium]
MADTQVVVDTLVVVPVDTLVADTVVRLAPSYTAMDYNSARKLALRQKPQKEAKQAIDFSFLFPVYVFIG